ncbi:MAG: hypothetical protein OXM54_01500 [Acidimicrobiaceae bacterium]|nr:hypothetical protein [Acidimicrobiaceae bacterium]
MTWITEMFRRVRWSDGLPVSYRQDRVALGLHLWSQASGITVTILWIASSRWAAWWVLIPLSIANGVGFQLVARNRLRRAVQRVEALGSAGQALVKVGPAHWTNQQLNRFYDYGIRLCDQKAEEFQARAESAKADGKQWTAARYLRRAERERKYSKWSKWINERSPHPF